MKKSVHGDDPVSQEILHFKKQREEADRVEQVFRNIRSLYNSTNIDKIRGQIEDQFMNHENVYRPVNANLYFEELKKDVVQNAFNSRYIKENKIVSSFNQPEERHNDDYNANNMQQTQHGILKNPLGGRIQHDPAPLSNYQPSKITDTSQVDKYEQQYRDLNASRASQDKLRSSQRPIVPGNSSEAKLSSDKTEVQLTYAADKISVEHDRTIDISTEKGRPITIKAIDSKNVLIGYDDGALKIMDTDSCSIVRQYRFASPITVIECLDAQNPMIPVLCGTGSPGNSIVSLELQRPQPTIIKHIFHTEMITAMEVLKDGKFLSASKDGSIALWSNEVEAPIQTLKNHTDKITSLSSLNNYRTLLSAGEDSTIKVYDYIANEITLKNTLKEKAPVTSIKSFYGNTKFAITCLVSGLLRVWNVVEGE
jgi:WD domain, G-beta repeat